MFFKIICYNTIMTKIGIIGLGLIGGSIFKSLTALNYDVVGVSQTVKLPNVSQNYDTLTSCDIVFVCVPMNKTLSVLDKLETILPHKTIVADVCSLKEFVCQKKYLYNFIPSHPMAGTENKGFENSYDGMFKNAKWVICKKEYPNILDKVISDLGAKIVVANPKEHDEAVALISHMPMVMAQALFLTAQNNPLALEIASSGFRDMTRLALSNEEMACDMVNMNSKNIQNAILNLYKCVGYLTTKNYPEIIKQIKNQRQKMFK